MTIKIKVTSKMPENSKKAFEIYESNAVRHLNRVANHFKNTVQKLVLLEQMVMCHQ